MPDFTDPMFPGRGEAASLSTTDLIVLAVIVAIGLLVFAVRRYLGYPASSEAMRPRPIDTTKFGGRQIRIPFLSAPVVETAWHEDPADMNGMRRRLPDGRWELRRKTQQEADEAYDAFLKMQL